MIRVSGLQRGRSLFTKGLQAATSYARCVAVGNTDISKQTDTGEPLWPVGLGLLASSILVFGKTASCTSDDEELQGAATVVVVQGASGGCKSRSACRGGQHTRIMQACVDLSQSPQGAAMAVKQVRMALSVTLVVQTSYVLVVVVRSDSLPCMGLTAAIPSYRMHAWDGELFSCSVRACSLNMHACIYARCT